MAEEFIGKREFDGYAQSMRDEVQRVSDLIRDVSIKIDGLVNIRIEEARMMGQITESIRAINDRLERHEAAERALEVELKLLKDGKTKWWSQLGIYVAAAVIGAFFAKYYH
jgi:hypothetical protein